jgi:hypothetical protein
VNLTKSREELAKALDGRGGSNPDIVHTVGRQLRKRRRRKDARDSEVSIHRDARCTPSLTCSRSTKIYGKNAIAGQDIRDKDVSHRERAHDTEEEVSIGDRRVGEEDESRPRTISRREATIVCLAEG